MPALQKPAIGAAGAGEHRLLEDPEEGLLAVPRLTLDDPAALIGRQRAPQELAEAGAKSRERLQVIEHAAS
jgi:hypothetical protein